MLDLARFDAFGRIQQRLENWPVGTNLVAGYPRNNESELIFREAMLVLQVPVNGYKNIKSFLRQRQQRTILRAVRADLAHGTDNVPWERGPDSRMNAFV